MCSITPRGLRKICAKFEVLIFSTANKGFCGFHGELTRGRVFTLRTPRFQSAPGVVALSSLDVFFFTPTYLGK